MFLKILSKLGRKKTVLDRGPSHPDFNKAKQSPGWMSVLRGDEKADSEEYGVSSFVFRSRKPFHPERVFCFLFFSFRLFSTQKVIFEFQKLHYV